MTDPKNVKELLFNPQVNPGNIFSFSYHNNFLWMGKNDTQDKESNGILVAQRKEDHKFNILTFLHPAIINHKIANLVSISEPEAYFIHYKTYNDDSGPVELIYPGGFRKIIATNASFVVSSNLQNPPKRIYSRGSTSSTKVAIINENEISFYKFIGEILVLCSTIQAENKVQAAGMNKNFLIFCSNKKYFKIDLTDKMLLSSSDVKPLHDTIVVDPFVLPFSDDSILVTYKESMIVYSSKKSEPTIYTYHPTYKKPKFIYGNEEYFYQFFDDCFIGGNTTNSEEHQEFQIPNVRLCCKAEQELIVMTNDKWYKIGSIPPASELANQILTGKKEEVYSRFKDLSPEMCSEAMRELFDVLWRHKKYVQSVELVSKFVWLNDPFDLLALFKELTYDTMFEEAKDKVTKTSFSFKDDDAQSVFSLLEVAIELILEKTRNKTSDNKYNTEFLATVLGEVYVFNQKTRKLNSLVRNDPDCKVHIITQFIEANIKNGYPFAPSFAIIQTAKGNIREAMRIWKRLYDASKNEFFLLEASFTLQECDSSPLENDILKTELEWMYNREKGQSPAINALMSIKHNPDTVINFLVEKNREREKILYYDFLVNQESFVPRDAIIKAALTEYIRILAHIDDSDFQRDAIEFTESYRSKKYEGEELIAKVKEELKTKVITVLKNHHNNIDKEFLEEQISILKDQEIILTIYSVKEKYAEALKLIIGDKDLETINKKDPVFDQIQDFCRNAPDPPTAFSVAYRMLGSQLILSRETCFLEKNILYSDPVSTLEMIPEDANLSANICSIIKTLYDLLLSRDVSLGNQIAISRSIETDTNYRLSRAQSAHCTIDSTTRCNGCGDLLGNVQFYMSPTKEVYHTRCKPDHVH